MDMDTATNHKAAASATPDLHYTDQSGGTGGGTHTEL
jgi:hypothetical protein